MLLEMALDAPPEVFNKRQMERLSENYDKNRSEADDSSQHNMLNRPF